VSLAPRVWRWCVVLGAAWIASYVTLRLAGYVRPVCITFNSENWLLSVAPPIDFPGSSSALVLGQFELLARMSVGCVGDSLVCAASLLAAAAILSSVRPWLSLLPVVGLGPFYLDLASSVFGAHADPASSFGWRSPTPAVIGIWGAAGLFAAFGPLVARRVARSSARARSGLCRRCSHPLLGFQAACPECGTGCDRGVAAPPVSA
jgi:hypothetical protein